MTFSTILGVFLVLIQVIPGSGPKQHGRVGNDHLDREQYEEAVNAYQKGLSSYRSSEKTDQTYYGLQNNLGVTLHQQQNFEAASRAFDTAISYAPNSDAASVASFNAGNNAFTNQQMEAALEHYRAALLANPENEDAKFNYEFVSRQLQEQQDEEQQDEQNEEQQDEQNEEQQDEQNEEQQDEQNEEQQDEQNEEQQDEQNEEQQDEQNEEQQGEQNEEQQGEQNEEQQQTPLTMEQAERILEALENEEKELLREVQKIEGRPRRVTKDW